MLERLYIKNFALIEEINLDFCEKFNVLTGETGAGKSIVIDAVSVLLGGRAQTEYVRHGCDMAVIEGVFFVPQGGRVFESLVEYGVDCEEGTLILSREIAINGRNSCRINGRNLTLGQYRVIGQMLVEIHGQHNHQYLLQPHRHLEILDRFGKTEHFKLLQKVKESYQIWKEAKTELEDLHNREQDRLQRIDFLSFQLAEIKGAGLKENEEEELQREANILANAEKISMNLNSAYLCIFGGENEATAYELVGKAVKNLEYVRELNDKLEKTSAEIESCLYQLEEGAAVIRDYLENIDYSPRRLEETEKRLYVVKELCRKYGGTVKEVLLYGEKAQAELDLLNGSGERAEELKELVEKAWQEYFQLSALLSEKRREIGAGLDEEVTSQLLELAMPDAVFRTGFSAVEPSARGNEEAEFLISANPGEPLLPVAKIASGGELSRMMLAFKSIFAGLDGIDTLIFDEIDSGIGGKAAQKVAEKLEKISENQQVICVTHSSIIAALADRHLLLEKQVERGRTQTFVRYLSKDERVEELTRMMGGERQTDDLKRHASQILKK